MTQPPKVTVIVPTYNRAELLRGTIDSVLAQTFQDFELLVMDDCSKDTTEALCRSFTDPRLKYVRQPSNLGVGRNWTDGIERATGKYVCLLMDDDRYGPEFLWNRISVLEANPECALCFSPFTKVWVPTGEHTVSRVFPCTNGTVFAGEELIRMTSIGGTHVGAQIFRRKEIQGVVALSTPFDLIIDSAFIIWLVVTRDLRAVFVSATDSFISEHALQVFHRRRRDVYVLSDKLFGVALTKCAARPVLVRLLNELRAELVDQWAYYEAAHKRKAEAGRLWLRALRIDPRAFVGRLREKLYTLRVILGLSRPRD